MEEINVKDSWGGVGAVVFCLFIYLFVCFKPWSIVTISYSLHLSPTAPSQYPTLKTAALPRS